MKPRYLSVACIITAFSMMILMATLPLIAPQQAHASPASLPENVHLVEEGIVANPEVLEQDITQLNADDSDDILWEGYLSGELQLSPTWQNPAYATAVSTYAAGGNIVKTACTSTNYKVISTTRSGVLGNSYYYTCWAGTGYYYNGAPMGRYGNASVSIICPGNNRGSIEQQYIDDVNNYTWSPYRGPHPNNSNYCYTFPSLRVYRAIKLNQ